MNNDVFMYYADCRMNKFECGGNKQCISKKNSDRGSIYYSIVITFNNF